jgi:chromosome partitioning protein
VIDNGPTLGLRPVMSLTAATLALVVVNGVPLALEGLADVEKTIALVRTRLNPALNRRIVATMVNAQRKQQMKIIAGVRKAYGSEVFKAEIPNSAHLESGILRGGSVLAYASSSPGAVAYRGLTQELKRVK